MPNIASVLKEEIARVARKELRGETEKLKKAAVQHRSDIAALKRRVTALEQQLARFGKAKGAAPPTPEHVPPSCYSAKGLSGQRQRLGLYAADIGSYWAYRPKPSTTGRPESHDLGSSKW